MFRRNNVPNGRGGRAFDASGSSGFAFLQSQLELVNVDLVKPLQDVTHARDISMEFGGGFAQYVSSWASNYATTGGNQYGLQGTNNTDIPLVQVDIQKGTWQAFNWAASMLVTYIDLERMKLAQATGQSAPFSLQELMEEACQSVWAKAMDRVTYLGWLGQPGIVNNPVVPEFTVTGGTWASKLANPTGPASILADVNQALNETVQNSGFNIQEAQANRMLLPYTQFALLTQPMSLNGVGGFDSILSYIERNCVAAKNGIDFKIYSLPDPWIAGQGVSSSNRAVVYRNSKKSLYMKVPQPMQRAMTVPTTRDGGAYETIFNGCIGVPMWLRSTTAVYMDGI
jgi:hypothetical protein